MHNLLLPIPPASVPLSVLLVSLFTTSGLPLKRLRISSRLGWNWRLGRRAVDSNSTAATSLFRTRRADGIGELKNFMDITFDAGDHRAHWTFTFRRSVFLISVCAYGRKALIGPKTSPSTETTNFA